MAAVMRNGVYSTRRSQFHPVTVQTERYSLQDSRPVYLTLLAQDTSLSFLKRGSFYGNTS